MTAVVSAPARTYIDIKSDAPENRNGDLRAHIQDHVRNNAEIIHNFRLLFLQGDEVVQKVSSFLH